MPDRGITPKVVLHIGMHKTGSSSLQRVFSRNAWLLAAAGVTYWAPRVGWRRASKAVDLDHAIRAQAAGQGAHPRFGTVAEVLARMQRARGRVLISAEGLSGQDPAFARACAPLRGQARVIVYLRRQDAWAESFYRQMVRSAEVAERRPFAAFLADPWTQAHLDYAALLSRWEDALGFDALRVAIYPPRAPLLQDFLDRADLPPWITRLPYARNRANPSLSRAEVAAHLGLSAAEVGFADDTARRAFLDRFSAQNEGIRARFRPDLDTLFEDGSNI